MIRSVFLICFFAIANACASCQSLLEKAAVSLQQSPRCQLEADVATWIMLGEKENLFTLNDYQRFVQSHPGWPLKKIIKHAERTFKTASASDVMTWTKLYQPQTAAGVLFYLQATAQLQEKFLKERVKKAWAHTVMSTDQEQQFLDLYGHLLNDNDNHQRAQTMINTKNLIVARRQLSRLCNDKRDIIIARLALLQNDVQGEQLYLDLSSTQQQDPVVLLNYIQWLVKQKDDKVYSLMLDSVIRSTVDPHGLWKEMHILIRRAFENNDWDLALQLAEHHPLKKGSQYYDAEWLRGWLLIHIGKQQQRAQDIFKNLYATMQTPICRAKSAFWTARLYENNNKAEAKQWYKRAAHYPMTFYGQQASRLLGIPLTLKSAPVPSKAVQGRFNERPFVKIIKRLQHPQLKPYIRKFLSQLLVTVPADEKILVAKLAVNVDPEFSVAIAKDAASHTEGFEPEAYKILPAPLFKPMRSVDPALIHAIIRKESTFNSQIVSSAGATGMMQVMPATGQRLAKQLKLPFDSEQLKQPDYNIKLGCEYVRQQLENFDGSVVLMLAAYNAGPKPVRRWLEAFGDPRAPQVDIIDWIEKIPYGETRNYVQRVMENYRVYQTVLTTKGYTQAK